MSACPVTGYPTPDIGLFYGEERPFDLRDQTDDGLKRLRRYHSRRASDLTEEGDLKQARRESYMAREVHDQQMIRFRLRMRYGAVEDHVGTTSFDCYIRHGEAPTYALAMSMDAARARVGRKHTLNWRVAS